MIYTPHKIYDMALDVDAVAMRNALEEIHRIVFDIPHGERTEVADDVIEFSKIGFRSGAYFCLIVS